VDPGISPVLNHLLRIAVWYGFRFGARLTIMVS
jgi:hypothetical protein